MMHWESQTPLFRIYCFASKDNTLQLGTSRDDVGTNVPFQPMPAGPSDIFNKRKHQIAEFIYLNMRKDKKRATTENQKDH